MLNPRHPLLVICSLGLLVASEVDPKLITQYDVERAPWPQVGGPYGNCSAPPAGLKLVRDLTQAKLVWASEQIVPSSSPMVGKKPAAGGTYGGEYCSPIIADGKVYLSYWRLTGRSDWVVTEDDLQYWVKSGRNPVNGRPESDTADDILLCVDLETGKTIWEKVVGTGRPIAGYKSGAHMACAWWDGKVVFAGCNSSFYCVDGTTGETVWKTGGRGKGSGRDTHFATPMISGGVAFINGSGYDVATGKKLWSLSGKEIAKKPQDFGAPWLHDGVPYFLFNCGLVEAETGKVCWVFEHAGGGAGPAVYGDLAVIGYRGNTARHRGDGSDPKDWPNNSLAVFRISPKGYEELWSAEAPPVHGALYTKAVIHQGRAIGTMTHAPGDSATKASHNIAVDLTTGNFELQAVPGRWPTRYTAVAAEGRIWHAGGKRMDMGITEGDGFGDTEGVLANSAETTGAAYVTGRIIFRQRVDMSEPHYRLVCYDVTAR